MLERARKQREEDLDLHPIALLDVGNALAHFLDYPSEVEAQYGRVLLDEIAEGLNTLVDGVEADGGLLKKDLSWAWVGDGSGLQ